MSGKKYADIIVNLQMKNDFYWLIKHFDDRTLDHIRSHFDKDSGKTFINAFMQLQNEAIKLQNADQKQKALQDIASGYVEQALGVFFSRSGINPFPEGNKNE